MSRTGAWSYTNAATVYPMVFDSWKSVWTAGTPYLIDCTWVAENKTAVDDTGKEFTTTLTFYTELKRDGSDVVMPQRDWYIAKGDTTVIEEPVVAKARIIRAITEWDMSPFGQEPDFKIMT